MPVMPLIRSDTEFRDWLKKHIPKKGDFQSFDGSEPFNNKTPALINIQTERNDSVIAGIAADYLFRFLIAAYINNNKEDVLLNLNAFTGLKAVRYKAHIKYNISDYSVLNDKSLKVKTFIDHLFRKYEKAVLFIRDYVNNKNDDLNTLARICVWFAYLESYMRSYDSEEAYKAVIQYNKLDHTVQVDKVLELAEVFKKCFLSSAVINKDSTVIFNPNLGEYSNLIGGADADVFIDGTIYEFKAVKKIGYQFDYIAQLYVYYLLYLLDNKHLKTSPISKTSVTKVAFYYANYGQIFFVDCNKLDNTERIEREFKDFLKNYKEESEFKRELGDIFSSHIKSYFPQFSDHLLDPSVFGVADVNKYLSLAYPTYSSTIIDVKNMRAVPWIGNVIPKQALESKTGYFVNIQCHFKVKKGKEPFILSKRGLLYPRNEPLKMSMIKYEGKNYAFISSHDGTCKVACPDIYLCNKDFELFLERYDVKDLIIKTGIYFTPLETTQGEE